MQTYWFPGPNGCLTCHTGGAGQVLGIKSRHPTGLTADASLDSDLDQLQWLSDASYFSTPLSDEAIAAIEPLRALDDETATAETHVRSYLDSNYSHCHGAIVIDRALWDGRFTTPLAEQGLVMGELAGDYASDAARVVRPGVPSLSILHQRTETTDRAARMPSVGRAERDEEFVTVLEEWIKSLPPPPYRCPPAVREPSPCRDRQQEKAHLRIDAGAQGDRLGWDHVHGPQVTAAELLDPSVDSTASYALCVHDDGALSRELIFANECAEPACWTARSPGTLAYPDRNVSGAVAGARLRAGAGRTRFSLAGGGPASFEAAGGHSGGCRAVDEPRRCRAVVRARRARRRAAQHRGAGAADHAMMPSR
ncbi:MAG TPA: hypothetical protein VEC57_06125 [Candidatus Limnocylindrales bacterium]|nr:hypothetical protein [Candidatus Limnocylindrales bacterium]